MKICLGALKNKRIAYEEMPEMRPTKQRIRKCIFDIVMHRFFRDFGKNGDDGDVDGINVLDGFSGTGAFGFEALSLGAKFVQFVEKDKKTARGIVKSIKILEEQLPLQNKCSLFVGDLLELKSRIRFDLIFLDPPYFHGLAAGAVQHLLLNKNICEGAVLIIECAKKESALIDKQIQILGMRNIVSKTYGKISIHFYTCGEHTQP